VDNTVVALAQSDPLHRLHLVDGVDAGTYPISRADAAREIRLIIARPVHLMREGLAAALRGRDGVMVTETVDLSPAGLAKLANTQPDVVLVDLGQTDHGVAARLIGAASPGARLVAFGLDETDHHVFACAAAGYSGYVAREKGADELHRAVVDAVGGRMHCAPHIAAAMFARLTLLLREREPQRSLPTLSQRENEILALVDQGRSNKEIARQLAISSATVKNHMHNLLQKLQVSRRGQAAARLRSHPAA
jgi:two-component system, NarL family, nitrate/nitrite response regulator NarL